MENVATEEFISRTEALKDFESCNAENPNWTPQRVKRSCCVSPPPTLRRWCMDSGCEQMMTGIASQQFSAPFAAKSGALRRTMT